MERIALKDLCFDAQIRQRIDDNKVEEYAEMYRQGQEEAIKVVFDGKKYYVADGEHRVRAAKKAGHTDIKAEITRGTLLEAKLLNYTINKKHGISLTATEKKAFCISYIKQLLEEKSDKSNYKIAEELGIGEATVRRYKEEINASSDAKPANADGTRVTGDKTVSKEYLKIYSTWTDKNRKRKKLLLNKTQAEKLGVPKSYISGSYDPEFADNIKDAIKDRFTVTKTDLDKMVKFIEYELAGFNKTKEQDEQKKRAEEPLKQERTKQEKQEEPRAKEEAKQQKQEQKDAPPKEEPKQQEEPKQEPKQEEAKQQDEPRQQREEGYWTKKVKEKIRESDERFQEIAKEIETLSQLMEFVVGSEVFYEMLKIGHREIAKKYHADKNNGVESEKMSEANEIWNAFKKFMKRN